MKVNKTCCIILAAGLSSRMGSFKPLLPIKGKPAIVFLLDKLFTAGVDFCVVVTGHNAGLIRQACADMEHVIWGYNPDYASTGMFESAKIGFELVPEDCSRILLTPADIPMVKTETLRALINTKEPLLFPSYHYRKGHPVSIAGSLLPFLKSYEKEGGLHGAFSALQAEPAYLVTDDSSILMDMDTPDDYQKLLAHLKKQDDDNK